jgi:hypothetical protein
LGTKGQVYLYFVALYGSSDLEAAKIDEIVDTVAELNFNILNTVFVSDESAKVNKR